MHPHDRAFGAAKGALTLALTAALALSAPAPGRAAEIETSSTVAAALVYPSGARVTRAARFTAPVGRHELVVADLPSGLDEASLRVSGEAQGAGFEILGIAYRRVRPRVEPLSEPERQALLDRIEAQEWALRAASDAVAEARARLDYMQAFRKATVGGPIFAAEPNEAQSERGGPGGLFGATERWTEAWALIGAESDAARSALRAGQRAEAAERDALDALRDALDQVGPPPPARNVLTVSINAPEGVAEGALDIEYLAAGARWAPLYDLKLDTARDRGAGLKGALDLYRLAAVTQNTGEDWTKARLSLSTARPSGRVAAQAPQAQQVVLAPDASPSRVQSMDGLLSPDEAEAEADLRSAFNRAAPAPAAPMEAQVVAERRAPAATTSALAAYSGAGVVYEIPDPVTIPGDGEPRQVLIGVESGEVDLAARAAPSRDETAYLYAMRQNGPAPLLPGRASIFRDGVFHGQFDLAYVAPNSESAVPFGRLDDVTVSHVVRTQTTGEAGGLFSSSNRRRSRFALRAENTGETPRRVTLLDAAPYSETEEIEVTYQGPAPSERNVEGARGVMAWTFELDPGEAREIAFGYDLSWPEGREIYLRPGR
ncbi:MAG: mucoidy inhibitor MuiA family protein [Pseudomonadota bacterium]